MTYNRTAPLNSEWITLDNTTNILSGTPPQVAALIVVIVYANDPHFGNIDVTLTITQVLNGYPTLTSSLPDIT